MESLEQKYQRVTKRVKELKGFYGHIKIFVIINVLLYLLRSGAVHSLMPNFPLKAYYFDWVDYHLIIWMIILGVHALYVYRNKLPFLKNWENRQIQKYMDEDEHEIDKYQ